VAHEGLWLMRMAAGYSKRANSVTCLGPDGDPDRIARVEAHYRRHGLTPTFRLSPLAPDWLDAELAGRGYTVLDPTLTLIAPGGDDPDPAWHEEAAVSPAWCLGYAEAAGVPARHQPTMQAMFARIVPEVAFGTLRMDGAAAAWAMVALDGPWAGISDAVVRPDLRGRGLGRRLMRATLARAAGRTVWLQVTAANSAARALYASLGFTEAYRGRYRIAPDR
jgi:ribosomal protein S18 acetylase RimI-like enzyme